jgi:hypothetical protein
VFWLRLSDRVLQCYVVKGFIDWAFAVTRFGIGINDDCVVQRFSIELDMFFAFLVRSCLCDMIVLVDICLCQYC